MKYASKPVSDGTYIVYKSHLRRARRAGNKEAIAEWERKIGLAGREIPPLEVDVDPSTFKHGKVGEEMVQQRMSDEEYLVKADNFLRALATGNKPAQELWKAQMLAGGRETPGVELMKATPQLIEELNKLFTKHNIGEINPLAEVEDGEKRTGTDS